MSPLGHSCWLGNSNKKLRYSWAVELATGSTSREARGAGQWRIAWIHYVRFRQRTGRSQTEFESPAPVGRKNVDHRMPSTGLFPDDGERTCGTVDSTDCPVKTCISHPHVLAIAAELGEFDQLISGRAAPTIRIAVEDRWVCYDKYGYGPRTIAGRHAAVGKRQEKNTMLNQRGLLRTAATLAHAYPRSGLQADARAHRHANGLVHGAAHAHAGTDTSEPTWTPEPTGRRRHRRQPPRRLPHANRHQHQCRPVMTPYSDGRPPRFDVALSAP